MPDRTPEEVFGHHAEALIKGDLDELVADYSDDAVLITPTGPRYGREGARESFTELLGIVPEATWEVPVSVFAGNLLLIEWKAQSSRASIADGVDTFVFADGMISGQTIRYTVQTSP